MNIKKSLNLLCSDTLYEEENGVESYERVVEGKPGARGRSSAEIYINYN